MATSTVYEGIMPPTPKKLAATKRITKATNARISSSQESVTKKQFNINRRLCAPVITRIVTQAIQSRPNLYLVGFMGTGKSTVGRGLATRLGLRFLDSDHAIEKAQGRSIPEIFAAEGEAYFRQLEKDFVEQGHPRYGCVVSCGGGLVVQPGMIERLKQKGLVACLFASAEVILNRTAGNKNRPLLNVENPRARIAELLAEREPIYLQAGTCIYTDHRPMLDVVAHLERFYMRESKKFKVSS